MIAVRWGVGINDVDRCPMTEWPIINKWKSINGTGTVDYLKQVLVHFFHPPHRDNINIEFLFRHFLICLPERLVIF